MRDMINVAFQQAWFGPFSIPRIYPKPECDDQHWPFIAPECAEHAGAVYDVGPFDGLKTTSMWAQRMAQIPIVNYAQARPRIGNAEVPEGLCPPGFMPVSSGVPGVPSKCVRWSPPSGMIGPTPVHTVNTQIPPSYTPNQITYPVKAYYGWDNRAM